MTRAPLALLLVGLVLAGLAALARAAEEAASEVRGRGNPPFVLLHSLGGDRSDWGRVAPLLARKHRVVLIDLPGHGQSPPLHEPISVLEVADAVEDVLIDRNVKGAVVVGHSYGSLVALELAKEHGKRVAAVVAIDASTFTEADSSRLSAIEELLRDRYSVFLNAIFGRMSRDPQRGDTLIQHASRVKQEVLQEYFRSAWREDYRPRIQKLRTPIHVVATPALWPLAESWTSARRRLGYETEGPAMGHRIDGSGHVVMMDQPDSLAAILESIAAGVKR